MPIARLASVGGSTFFRLGPPPYLATNVAVPVGVQFPLWPALIDQSLISAGDLGNAQYLWYRSDVDPALVATGETVFFARADTFSFTILGLGIAQTLNFRIATDNAFQARMTITPTLGVPFTATFNDGNTAQNFNDTTPPFNWQNVYNFTTELPLAIGVTAFTLELEIKAVNYAQPGGTPQTNTAGIIYSLEIGGFLTVPTVTPVVPPVISNPLV
jgi:hypothetical protein